MKLDQDMETMCDEAYRCFDGLVDSDGPLHVLAAIITNERYQEIDGILDLLLLSGMWVGQEVTVPLHVPSDATVHLGEDTIS